MIPSQNRSPFLFTCPPHFNKLPANTLFPKPPSLSKTPRLPAIPHSSIFGPAPPTLRCPPQHPPPPIIALHKPVFLPKQPDRFIILPPPYYFAIPLSSFSLNFAFFFPPKRLPSSPIVSKKKPLQVWFNNPRKGLSEVFSPNCFRTAIPPC